MARKKDVADAQASVVLETEVVGAKKMARKTIKPKPKKANLNAGAITIVAKDKGPQLNAEQRAIFKKLRAEIVEARQTKQLEYLRHVGTIVVDGLWAGDATKIDSDDAVFKALCADPEIKISQSNLWYAVRLRNPELLFGDAAKGLSRSHQKRLLHVAEGKRKDFAAMAVKKKLTVEQLEDAIKKDREPAEGKSKRGAKPLPPVAKRFSLVTSAVAKFNDHEAEELADLTEARAKVIYANVLKLRNWVTEWLPAFEAEIAKIAKIKG